MQPFGNRTIITLALQSKVDKFYKCAAFDRPSSRSVHEKKRPWKCGRCERAFALKQVLDTHVMAVHQKKVFGACPMCGKAITNVVSTCLY